MLTGESQTVKAGLGKGPRAAPAFASARQLPARGRGTEGPSAWGRGRAPTAAPGEKPCVSAKAPCEEYEPDARAAEGTQVMRGSPHPARPMNGRMQLLQCFPGCGLLPLQNKAGEDEGGAAGGKKGTI